MSAKKNKKSKKKPAVGSPAAGSNNKRAKNNVKNNNNQKNNNQNKNKYNNNKNNNNNSNNKQNNNQSKNNYQLNNKHSNNNDPKNDIREKQPPIPEKEKISKAAAEPVKPEKTEKPANTEKRVKKRKKKKSSFKRFAKKYNIGKIICAALLAIAFVAAIVYLVILLFTSGVKIPDEIKNAEYKGRLESSSVAIKTDMSEEQQKILAKSLPVKGNKSAFKFFANKEIVMDDYNDPALIEFGSVSTNDCILLAFLIDEDGNLLYRSLGVEPGEKISSVLLFDSVPYGKHKLTLIVNGYDPETNEKIGTQATYISLKIGG